jgi:hypothetical protein
MARFYAAEFLKMKGIRVAMIDSFNSLTGIETKLLFAANYFEPSGIIEAKDSDEGRHAPPI